MAEIADAVLEQLNNIVLVLDQKIRVTYVSPSVRKILGYQPKELLGNKWWSLTGEEAKVEEIKNNAKNFIAGNNSSENLSVERKVKTATGGEKWILWNISEGPNSSIISIGYDITKRKETEENLAAKNRELLEKNLEITDSILYAQKVQQSILPNVNKMKKHFTDLFVYYQPKDIVSGDFYWYYKCNNKIYIAAFDCTGHGVPGALVSVIGNALLREIIMKKGIEEPAKILSELDVELDDVLNKDKEIKTRDGMDIALCRFDLDKRELKYAGAQRPALLIRNGKITELVPNRFPIGYFYGLEKIFTTTKLLLEKNDQIYLFSDGYTDQFGGEKVKKFNRKRFRTLLLSVENMEMARQEKELRDAFNNWKGKSEQLDDVCVIGIKI